MKEIVILVPHKALISSIEDARYMFLMVNERRRSSGRGDVFSVRLAGLTKEVRLEKGMYSIRTDSLIHEIDRPDLIIAGL